MNLNDLFDMSLTRHPDRRALEVDDPEHRVLTATFGQLDDRANRMANVLASHGVRPGDRVAVYLANGIGFLDIFLASLRIGAIFVPVNVLYKARELGVILADAAPSMVVGAERDCPLLSASDRVVSLETLVGEAARASSIRQRVAIDADDIALLIYTSGTTGRSKGAALSHGNVVANAAGIVTAWCITDRDRYLGVLPLFHVHGLANGVCAWLASGCRMKLVERFDRSHIEAWFETFQPTLFFGVPTMYVRLLEMGDHVAARIGETVRLFVSGSAPLPAPVFEAFRRKFGHAILERYGMSETLMLISNPYEGVRRPGTVGMPLPGVAVRIVDSALQDVPAGEPGQVLVRGPNVFHGYWRNPSATAAAFDAGWFRTGDVAERSVDGYYALRGRASDLIITGGFNVYPREIEECLLDVPGVVEVAVVGRPDAVRGEVPVAYVVAGAGFDPDAARAACARDLASFKVPRAFVRVDALPRNALGKVQKQHLASAETAERPR